ncbi:MAG: CPBP family intramembrane metalloprotease [Erysipelotrichaceae bacterium]|nr:CPBP family intramembrane metalloprotease [Erysipelotrichaceae bacterium]
MNRKFSVPGLVLGISAVIIMTLIERVVIPAYWIKSLFKMIVFFGAIIIYCVISKQNIKTVLHITDNRPSKKLIIFMVAVYLFIIVSFLILRNQLDLVNIRDNLFAKEHLTRENFWIVFLYIIIVNSFLEESFFRGFLFQAVKPSGTIPAYLISSFLFAVYHIGIVADWFNPAIFILCIAGLMGAGIFLQYIEQRNDNLIASWLVHAFANLAINTIGTIMILTL